MWLFSLLLMVSCASGETTGIPDAGSPGAEVPPSAEVSPSADGGVSPVPGDAVDAGAVRDAGAPPIPGDARDGVALPDLPPDVPPVDIARDAEDVPGPPPPLGVRPATEYDGPFRTCEQVAIYPHARGPYDVPPRINWAFRSHPTGPVFVFEPVRDHVVLVSAVPGTYVIVAEACNPDDEYDCVEDELTVDFELLADADGDGLGDTCADAGSGVMLVGVLEPTAVLTCERKDFAASGTKVGGGRPAYNWELLYQPSLSELEMNTQDKYLEVMAATPGRYGFRITACDPDDPGRCRSESVSVTVSVAADFEGVWIDERCSDAVGEDTHLSFTLPYEGPEQTAPFEVRTALELGDVVFDMDATGSMDSAIDALKDSLESSIIPRIAARITDVAVAVTSFRDVPSGLFGDTNDWPFRLEQRVTRRPADARLAVAALVAGGGGDGPESGFEALYQIATGRGRDEGALDIPAFDPGPNYVAGIAEGAQGGVGFRLDGARVVVQITDAPAHSADEPGYGFGATREQAYTALTNAGVSVIGVLSGNDSAAARDLEEMARETNATVPPCAWDDDRPPTCPAGTCCTGVDGAGRARDAAGKCPLVFHVPSGDGLDESVVSGIEALLASSVFDVSAVVHRDEGEFAYSGIDTSCLVESIVPLAATPRGCADAPVVADLDDDEVLDGFAGVAPGSQLSFEVRARNDCVREDKYHQVFTATLEVIASDGTRLGTRILVLVVPPLGR